MSNRIEIHSRKILHTLWRILRCSPEPAGSNTRITFRNRPLVSVFVTNCVGAYFFTVNCIIIIIYFWFWPCLFVRISELISNPSYCCVSFRPKQHTVWIKSCFFSFMFLNGSEPFLKFILLISGSASFCTVHPHFFKMSIISIFLIAQDFFQLIVIIFIIIFCIPFFYISPS